MGESGSRGHRERNGEEGQSNELHDGPRMGILLADDQLPMTRVFGSAFCRAALPSFVVFVL